MSTYRSFCIEKLWMDIAIIPDDGALTLILIMDFVRKNFRIYIPLHVFAFCTNKNEYMSWLVSTEST